MHDLFEMRVASRKLTQVVPYVQTDKGNLRHQRRLRSEQANRGT